APCRGDSTLLRGLLLSSLVLVLLSSSPLLLSRSVDATEGSWQWVDTDIAVYFQGGSHTTFMNQTASITNMNG
ncbi:MAG: hypothetical protein ACFFBU_09785, partial [Promethearchaeota archaeon]